MSLIVTRKTIGILTVRNGKFWRSMGNAPFWGMPTCSATPK